MLLFYDTETTGFPIEHEPFDSKFQPHCVQLAATLTENDGKEISSINLTIKPDGWDIPEQSSNIHGITTELAKKRGIREVVAAACFFDLVEQCDKVVAHNEQFDRKIVSIMFSRSKRKWLFEKPSFCTMEASSPIVNLPPTERMVRYGINKPKSPKLEECYKFFFGEELNGAHDALVDVRACARVYFHLKSEGHIS